MNLLRKRRIALSGLFFLAGLSFASWASRIPDFQQLFDLSEGQLGTLLLGMPLGSLIALPLAGWAVDKYGSRKVIVTGSLLYALSLLSIGYTGSVIQLGVAVVFFGMMGNIMNISLNTQALLVEDGYNRSILASFHGLWSLAGFAGAGIGALMIKLDWAPINHYWVVTGIMLLILVSSFNLLFKEEKRAGAGGLMLKKPDALLLRIGLVGFFGMMCEGCMFDWSGVYLKKVVVASPDLVPLGYVTFMAAMASGRFFSDTLANKWSKIVMLRISGTLICLGLLIAVIYPTFWTAVVGFLLVGFGTASVIPLSYSIAGRSKMYSPSISLALVSTISFFGFLLGPPMIGFIAELFDLQVSFAVIALMGMCITLLVSIKTQLFESYKVPANKKVVTGK
ncbi:MFS transporter [Echinicola strongylocentroti]|uniref:MFS transporter n=1 Tax=Echinicola strongylocentroti TaxID=1795355 RepID=A0A2Z4ILW9_9BACT|nr:MFS transporter [Echinicola strongylocentroti]AWW31709.1 MFS transporter [Echinicola strongylocentroti]